MIGCFENSFLETRKQLLKPLATLVVLSVIAYIVPTGTIDPWGIFNLNKILTLIQALVLIQILAEVALRKFGSRIGSILAGFLGGLVSSTATTASIAKRSSLLPQTSSVSAELLTFLGATLAMLAEGAVILLYGTQEIHASILFLFFGPIVVTGLLIVLIPERSTLKTLDWTPKTGQVLG